MNKTGRIAQAIFSGFLCSVCLFLLGGSTALLLYVMDHGLDNPPEMFGWLGGFLLFGFRTAIFGSPIALVFAILVFIKKNWRARHIALMSGLVGAAGGVIVCVASIVLAESHIFSTETTTATYSSGHVIIRGDKPPFRPYSFSNIYSDFGGQPIASAPSSTPGLHWWLIGSHTP